MDGSPGQALLARAARETLPSRAGKSRGQRSVPAGSRPGTAFALTSRVSRAPRHHGWPLQGGREGGEKLLEKVTFCACSSLGCSGSQSRGKAGRRGSLGRADPRPSCRGKGCGRDRQQPWPGELGVTGPSALLGSDGGVLGGRTLAVPPPRTGPGSRGGQGCVCSTVSATALPSSRVWVKIGASHLCPRCSGLLGSCLQLAGGGQNC